MSFDKELIARRFSRASGTYSSEAAVQRHIAKRMTALLRRFVPETSGRRVVEFGCGTGFYSRLLLRDWEPEQLWLNDLCDRMSEACADMLGDGVTFHPGDAEAIPFPEGTNLITSCSTLQWFDDPEAFFRKCHDCLADDGYLAFTTFGQENMCEVSRLTGHGIAYRTQAELANALEPLYDLVYVEEEMLHPRFDTPMQVLRHLKLTGVTGTSRHRWTRAALQTFAESYVRQFGDEASVPLTYHPIYIVARKKRV